MRKNLVVLMMMVGLCAFAQDDNPWLYGRGWFVAGSIGVSDLDTDIYDPEDNLDFEVNDSGFAAEAGGGFQFSRYFGLEASLMYLDDLKTWSDGRRLNLDTTYYKFNVYGRLPVGDRWAFLAKGGVFYGEGEQESFTIEGERFRRTDWEYGASLGLSAHYRITPQLSATLHITGNEVSFGAFTWDWDYDEDTGTFEWDFDDEDRDLITAQIGLRYRFK